MGWVGRRGGGWGRATIQTHTLIFRDAETRTYTHGLSLINKHSSSLSFSLSLSHTHTCTHIHYPSYKQTAHLSCIRHKVTYTHAHREKTVQNSSHQPQTSRSFHPSEDTSKSRVRLPAGLCCLSPPGVQRWTKACGLFSHPHTHFCTHSHTTSKVKHILDFFFPHLMGLSSSSVAENSGKARLFCSLPSPLVIN